MFPAANKDNVEVIMKPDGSWFISKWSLQETQPTQEDIISCWNANQQAILNANKPPLSEIEQIKKQQADLTFTLMMNGVI